MTPNMEYVIITVGAVVGFLAILGTIARMYRKVGPNRALLIYGIGRPKVVTGGGALIVPMFQQCRELSLELMSFDVAPKKELYTHQGVAVLIDAVTQLKVKNDEQNVRTAAEQFLDKSPDDRESAIRLVMEGHLRGIVGQLTVEQIVKEPEMVGDKVRSTCAGDLAKMGLEMISFTIKEVRDQNEYIKNMGTPDIERIKKDANIATAEAQRDTEIKRAMAMREAAVAKAQADQERVIAETASQAKQAEAQRDLEIKKAQYVETVQRQRAQADKSYEIQANVMQQQVVAEQVKIQQVERQEQVKVQESEILRRKAELIATELESANVEAQRRQVLADGEKRKLELEAAGQAAAIRQQGEAEADIIRLKGQAEAAAMQLKADAWRAYGQAAVLDKLLGALPEIVRAISEPLTKVDKITVISSDGNGASGVNKITGDVAKMVAQVPALVESLSGISVGDLLRNLPKLGPAIQAAEAARAVSAPQPAVQAQAAGSSQSPNG